MENEPELIRDQMQETRTALTEKLEALEQQVTGAVQSTTSAVTETVENLTETVQETVGTVKETVEATVDTVSDTVDKTVETVKSTFDISGHVERHPFAMVFGSLAAGFFLGRMLTPSRDQASQGGVSTSWPDAMRHSAGAHAAAAPAPTSSYREQENGHRAGGDEAEDRGGIVGGLFDALGGPIDTLKTLGVSAVFGLMRDMMTRSVPGELGSRLKDWMNDLTEKMGAKPLAEPLLGTETDEQQGGEDQGEHQQQQQQQGRSGSREEEEQPARGAPSQKGQRNTGSATRR